MAKAPSEDLEGFLRRQEPGDLIAVMLELARDHEEVRGRLHRMQLADRPLELAENLGKVLAAMRRTKKFHAGREAREFGNLLEGWLDQVMRGLLPKAPAAALSLFEAFIEADAAWLECADDSDGAVGDAMRAGCRYWLQAAANCELPPEGWSDRLMRLVCDDAYGAREELLRCADLLLDDSALKSLIGRFEARMSEVLETAPRGRGLPHDVFKISAALSLLAEAKRDPDIKVRAVLQYSPDPNPVQRADFVRTYLDADRPGDALPWLQGAWGHLESSRLELLSDALGRLGRLAEAAPVRQRLFESRLSVFDLRQWLDFLTPADRPDALSRARELALHHDDPAAAATLLLEMGDPAAAEEKLLSEPERIAGKAYWSLVPLAEALRADGRLRGETVVYRALLMAILDRAYAKAYGHGARYWLRLLEIAQANTNLSPLKPHAAFEAEVRQRHARKSAFWARVGAHHVDRKSR